MRNLIITGLFMVTLAGPSAADTLALDNTLAEVQEDLKMFSRPKEVGKTWIEVEGKVHGAQPDQHGSLGGGAGYAGISTGGDYHVSNLEELLEALKKAKSGQVVYIKGTCEIDCTTRVYIEKLVLEVPPGVTLASNRGQATARGAPILSDAFATRPLIRAMGPGVRITGLRIRGPDPNRRIDHHRRAFAEGRGRDYYYKFPISDGIESEHPDLQVDNCELAGWSHAAVNLKGGGGHSVHHNYIHHNQYNGLGYGICLDKAEAKIQYNLFDFNRHSIAGTGRPGTSYEASYNVELGDSLSHCFDMHGGRDRKDGTDIAGTLIHIHHNVFKARQTPVVIRGTLEKECLVEMNWFLHHDKTGEKNAAVRGGQRILIKDNCYRD